MDGWIILALVASGLVLLSLITAAICFFKIFYRQKEQTERYPIPPGKIYEAYREQLVAWMMEIDEMPHEDIEIKSLDGLTLRGRYYEYKKGAPTEILFHGYRGTSYRDLCGGVYRCHALGRNALIVDHRASGRSEGKVITFGAKESRDILTWVEYFVRERDENAKIIITGISMGAASVLCASGYPLPKNVVGVLADCGYTSTRDIIKKVIRDMKLPANILYPFARLGAILFGGFDPDKRSAIDSMKRCKLPTIFFHGDADDFVPAYMSEENYTACAAEEKRLVIIKGAGHGLAFPHSQEEYLTALREFFEPILGK